MLVSRNEKRKILNYNLKVELINKTPLKERMTILEKHEKGELECLISVGVLSEGWDNPNCNIIVHLSTNPFQGILGTIRGERLKVG